MNRFNVRINLLLMLIYATVLHMRCMVPASASETCGMVVSYSVLHIGHEKGDIIFCRSCSHLQIHEE